MEKLDILPQKLVLNGGMSRGASAIASNEGLTGSGTPGAVGDQPSG